MSTLGVELEWPLFWAYLIGSLAVTFAATAITVSYCLFRRLRVHPNSLIVICALSDLSNGIFFVVSAFLPDFIASAEHNRWLCALEAALPIGPRIVCGFWVLALAIDVYRKGQHPFSDSKKFVKFYHLTIWPFSFFLTLMIIVTFSYKWDEVDQSCWVTLPFVLIVFGSEVIVVCIACVFALALAVYRLLGMSGMSDPEEDPIPDELLSMGKGRSKSSVVSFRRPRRSRGGVIGWSERRSRESIGSKSSRLVAQELASLDAVDTNSGVASDSWDDGVGVGLISPRSSSHLEMQEGYLYAGDDITPREEDFGWPEEPSPPVRGKSKKLQPFSRAELDRRKSRQARWSLFRTSAFLLAYMLSWTCYVAGVALHSIFPSSDEVNYARIITAAITEVIPAVIWFSNLSFWITLLPNAALPKRFQRMKAEQASLLPALDAQMRQKLIFATLVNAQYRANDMDLERRRRPELADVTLVVRRNQRRAVFGTIQFKDYAPFAFRYLRESFGWTTQSFVASLESARRGVDSGSRFTEGRSGSFFLMFPDGKLILKTITKKEKGRLLKILGLYISYLAQNPHSLLMRTYGLYSIRLQRGQRYYFVIMENVHEAVNPIDERYDLKGSTTNRKAHGKSKLLMDTDFRKRVKTIDLPLRLRKPIVRQIVSDASFLRGLGILDYSMLVGVSHRSPGHVLQNNENPIGEAETLEWDQADDESGHSRWRGGITDEKGNIFYFGIIDILQSYDLKKRSERLLKVYIRRMNKHKISAQSPKRYEDRFVKFCAQIFLVDESELDVLRGLRQSSRTDDSLTPDNPPSDESDSTEEEEVDIESLQDNWNS